MKKRLRKLLVIFFALLGSVGLRSQPKFASLLSAGGGGGGGGAGAHRPGGGGRGAPARGAGEGPPSRSGWEALCLPDPPCSH